MSEIAFFEALISDNPIQRLIQLRDPKNDFIFNFNFDDKMKNL